MKQFIYLLIVSLVIVQSCVDQNVPETTFTLINNSTKDIIIEPYSRRRVNGVLSGGNNSADIIRISSGDKKSFLRVLRENRTFFSDKNIDSVRVVFEKQKVLVLICNDWPDMINCSSIFRGDTNYSHAIT
ncbi:MAG: hypothetical protein COB60_06920, partial [Flavobacteriaceae bacterium]